MEKTITQAQAHELVLNIPADERTIFSTKFVKRTTGELRHMVCRRGVKKGVTGVGMSYNPRSKNLLPVYDVQKQAFRMIACEDIREIKFHGDVYKVV